MPTTALDDLTSAVRALATERPAPVIAVDGPGGSGKSTLARVISAELADVVVVAGDDFYRPMPDEERVLLDAAAGYERFFDWQRLREQLLAPLRATGEAKFQRYDWLTGELGGWRTVPAGRPVVVEGVYTARPELVGYYDTIVYVDTPRDECLRRLRARGENSEAWIQRWRAAEDYYLDHVRPESHADFVVSGT